MIGREGSPATTAGSRALCSRLRCLEAVPSPEHPDQPASRAAPSLLAAIRQRAQPSPLNPGVWRQVLDETDVPGRETIVHAIEHGVPLTLVDAPLPGVRVPNHPLLYLDFQRVKEAVLKEERLGRYVQLPPSTSPSTLNISAMGVAPRFASFKSRRNFETGVHRLKPRLKHAAADDFDGRPVSAGPELAAFLDGLEGPVKLRVIHDLTHPVGENVNAFVDPPAFDLPTVVSFARRLSTGAYLWKGDIDSAFRIVPVRPRDWPLLAFHVDGTLYVDTRLPFGHALSPYYFCNFVGRPVLYVAIRRGATLHGVLSSYVDDFFGGCDDYDAALDQMEIWLRTCADLGVPVSQAKTFLPTRVLEVLGIVINTEDMTLTVTPERIQDILDEMDHVAGRKSVQKRDLERLAGKMTFVCSVVPGGRTFMRELLDTLNALREKKHWAHLSAGFRADLAWWQQFAHAWNGTEAIPPPITVPWHYLSSDASGEDGLGVFLFGAGLHVPLPLRAAVEAADDGDRDLIIAETELIAAVLLVSLAAPLVPGEHLLIGIDNTVALSWIDRGTARRPRAMRSLRFLWRVQAFFRIHVSTRYIPSEQNQLADACSRLDSDRFQSVASRWRASDATSLSRFGFQTNPGASYLHTASFGADGGAAGHLVELLVDGDTTDVRDAASEMDRILLALPTFASRLVAQQPDRLHHVPGHHRENWRAVGVFHDQGLRGLLGAGHIIYGTRGAESGGSPRGATVPARCGEAAGEGCGEGGAMRPRSPALVVPLGAGEPRRPRGPDGGDGGGDRLLGVSAPRMSRAKDVRPPSACAVRGRCPLAGRCLNPDGQILQDHSVCRASSSGRAAEAGRRSLVPLCSLQPVDVAAATPFIPDAIVRAVNDPREAAVAFQLRDPSQQTRASAASADGALLPSRLRPTGAHARRPHLEHNASWRLEDVGSGNVVRRGSAPAQPPRRAARYRAVSVTGVGPGPPL